VVVAFPTRAAGLGAGSLRFGLAVLMLIFVLNSLKTHVGPRIFFNARDRSRR
jgi:hypothetical protein